MKFTKLQHISLLFAVLLSACQIPVGRPTVPKEQNLADIYNPGRTSLNPDYSLHHVNDSLSLLYVRVFPAQLLFSEANEAGELRAQLRISFELMRLEEGAKETILADSASLVKTLNRVDARNSYFTGIPIKSVKGNKYFLMVNVYDVYRRTRNQFSLVVDKTTPFTAQNYKLVHSKSTVPVFSQALGKDQSFRIQFNQMGYDSLYIDFYGPDHSLPRPIFSSLPETPLKTHPDTSWVYPYNDTINYALVNPGAYIFRVDKTKREGLALMNFGDSFPAIKTADDMLGPLIFLTSSIEFRDIRMQQNRKLAIDNFWIGVAGNPDAARELIRVFYNRVLFANLNFSSYKEGWKTDRGMIYIVFGAPNMLEVNMGTEKWTYFTGRNTNPIEFTFERRENIFTNMDYQSVRDVSSNPYWRSAVQSWRKGKIYSSMN